MLPFQRRVDIFSMVRDSIEDAEFCVLSGTVEELKNIGAKRGKEALQANAALRLVTEKKLRIVKSLGPVDDAATQLKGGIFCTLDKQLASRLRAGGVTVATINSGRLLPG